MHRLRAVQEHGLRVHDGNIKSADHAARAAVKRDEATVHPGGTTGSFHGLTWRRGQRLRDGVVPRCELELEHVARVGGDAVRGEGQGRPADEHGYDLVRGGGCEWLAVDYAVRERSGICL